MCCHKLQPLRVQDLTSKEQSKGRRMHGDGELGWGQFPELLSCLVQPAKLGKTNYLLKGFWFIWLCHYVLICVSPLFLPEARERSHSSLWSSHFYWPLLVGSECRKIKAATFPPGGAKSFRLPENQFGISLCSGPIIPKLIHPTQLLLAAGIPRDTLRMCSASGGSSNTLCHRWHHTGCGCSLQAARGFPCTKPNATFFLGAQQEKNRRERGNTYSKKQLKK